MHTLSTWGVFVVGEAQRVEESAALLKSLGDPPQHFTQLVENLAHLYDCPMAAVTLVDADRTWLWARQGLFIGDLPRELSFCHHAIKSDDLFVVGDALEDPRFANNPFVVNEPQIRSYAGAPLISEAGNRIGTLCILHSEVQAFSDCDFRPLRLLADQSIALLQLQAGSHPPVAHIDRQIAKSQPQRSTLDVILDLAPVGLFETDANGQCVYVNETWRKMAGFSQDEALGDRWGEAIHPDDRQKVFAEWSRAAAEKRPFTMQYRFRNIATGEVFHVHGRSQALYDDDQHIVGYLGAVIDRSDQHALERSIEIILKNNQAGIFSYSVADDLLVWDDGLLEIYGETHESFDGRYETWRKHVHPDYVEDTEAKFQAMLERDEVFDTTFALLTVDGEKRFVHARAVAERDAAGIPLHVYGTNTDVTDEQRAIEEARQSALIAQQQAKLASIGELAAGVGHEINNPLAIAKGHLAVVLSEATDARLEKKLEKIDFALDRVTKIVNGLRTYARAEDSHVQVFHPYDCALQSVEMLQEIYEKAGIQLCLAHEPGAEQILVRGNQGKLQQVLMNLITNAKHAVEGSVDGKIVVHLQRAKSDLELSVADNGCGIPDEVLPRIFDPFFTTKEVNVGTGIGLSMVRNFILEMEGHISVESDAEMGTTFTVRIPVAQGVVPETLPPQKMAETRGPETALEDKRILVVDDEPELAELLGMLLEDMGHKVELAENGAVALDKIRDANGYYDLVISDMQMPRLSGEGLLQELRQIKGLSQPKFVLSTGGDRPTDVASDKPSPDDYLLKPYSFEQLSDLLERVCTDLA